MVQKASHHLNVCSETDIYAPPCCLVKCSRLNLVLNKAFYSLLSVQFKSLEIFWKGCVCQVGIQEVDISLFNGSVRQNSA